MDERSALKFYLLKNLIIRIDYDGALDSDVDNAVREVRTSFIGKGFALKESIENNANYTLPNPDDAIKGESIQPEITTRKNLLFQKPGKAFSISNAAIGLNVDASKDYNGSSEYLDEIICLYKALIEQGKGSISIKRIGIRKINSFIIDAEATLTDYISACMVPSLEIRNMLSRKPVIKNASTFTTVKEENYALNIISSIQTGSVTQNNEESHNAYQIVLDYDAYIDQNIPDINNKLLTDLNAEIFNVYRKALTDSFVAKLKEETFEDKFIFDGVNRYGQVQG